MAKFGKILGILTLCVVVAVAGLTLFIKKTVTDQRIRELVLPQAEKALGREVAIGAISVSLFSGVTVNDLSVKEADGHTDFVSARSFVLRYDLAPLLKKELVVREIRLEQPTVRIVRGLDGKFNFQSLALLAERQTPPGTAPKPASTSGELPLSLTIDKVRLVGARVSVRDERGELPAVDAEADSLTTLAVAQDGSLSYRGESSFKGNAVHGGLEPEMTGRADFDGQRLGFAIDLAVDSEKLHLAGEVQNYLKEPDLGLDLSSPSLDIDRWQALAAQLPAADKEKQESRQQKQKLPIAEKLPPHFRAHGQVRLDQATWRGLKLQDLNLGYTLEKGVLTASDFAARGYDGRLGGKSSIDLNRPEPALSGTLSLDSMEAGLLADALAGKKTDFLTGGLRSDVTFAGNGSDWPALKKTLTADGTLALANGTLRNNAVGSSLAALIGLPELNNLRYYGIAAQFKVAPGAKVTLHAGLDGEMVKADSTGTADLDGNLNLPVTLRFPPAASQRLTDKTSLARALTNEQGETVVHLKLEGTVQDPKARLDQSMLQDAVKQKTIEKLGELLGGSKKEEPQAPNPPQNPANLLKGLFGR